MNPFDEDDEDNLDVPYFEEIVLRDVWVGDENGDYGVIELYNEDKFFHKLKVQNRGTALHVAISNGEKDAVKQLVDAIQSKWKWNDDDDDNDETHPLRMRNERGATPLHIAAYRGFTDMCQCIIGKNGERKNLVKIKNKNGETPLFWAVLGQKTDTFVYLHDFFKTDVNLVMDQNYKTILHVAIRSEKFDLARIIMHCYSEPSISSTKDINGVTPLKELASRKSAFESGNLLSWWQRILYCYPVKLQDVETTLKLIQSSIERSVKDDQISIQVSKNDEELEKEKKLRPTLARLDCISYAIFLCYLIQRSILSLLGSLPGFKEIKSIKQKCLYGKQLLQDLILQDPTGGGDNTTREKHLTDPRDDKKNNTEKSGTSQMEDHNSKLEAKENTATRETKKIIVTGETPYLVAAKQDIVEIMREVVKEMKSKTGETEEIIVKGETPYLVAAKQGIVEIMRELEKEMKSVIHDRNSNNENVMLVAVKYRQPLVVQQLKKELDPDVFESLCTQVDNEGNTMLHLAAFTSPSKETTWKMAGPAMQMMWDIKWYKYIQDVVPENFKHITNKKERTPGEVFKEKHDELLKESTEWMKNTAESCSVVAALIAGLSFATSGSVPGGNKDTGKPALEGQPAFVGFAVSSLIGLYFSGTALIMFLSILTSRKQIEDFNRNLPAKLLGGLTSLFVSIVAMFISFCAGHFFVLTDKYGKHDILVELYIVFSLPVIYYAIVQLPLYFDLIQVIWKKVPPQSIKGVHL